MSEIKEVKIIFTKRELAKALNLPDGVEVVGLYTRDDPDVLTVKVSGDKFSREDSYDDNSDTELPILPYYLANSHVTIKNGSVHKTKDDPAVIQEFVSSTAELQKRLDSQINT